MHNSRKNWVVLALVAVIGLLMLCPAGAQAQLTANYSNIQRLPDGSYSVDVTIAYIGKGSIPRYEVYGATLGNAGRPTKPILPIGFANFAGSRTITFTFPASAGLPGIRTLLTVSTRWYNTFYGPVSGFWAYRFVDVTLPAFTPSLTSLELDPSSMYGGQQSIGAVSFDGAVPAGGAVVTLASSSPGVASVPSSITVPAGTKSYHFPVTTALVSSATPVRIDASYRGVTKSATLTLLPIPKPTGGVSYQAHVQNIGWMPIVSDGAVAGTTGRGQRLEAVRIWAKDRRIQYQAHVQNIGWMPVAADGAEAGTTGRSLRLEAIRIWVDRGHVEYYVHVQNLGWLGPYHDGEVGGTTGRSLRAEAVVIRVTD